MFCCHLHFQSSAQHEIHLTIMKEHVKTNQSIVPDEMCLYMQVTHVPLCVHRLTMVFRGPTIDRFSRFNSFSLSWWQIDLQNENV